MKLQELDKETIADYYRKWASGNPAFTQETKLLATKELHIEPGSTEDVMSQTSEYAQTITNDIKAPYFAEAVKNGELSLPIKDLGGEEAVESFVDQFTAYLARFLPVPMSSMLSEEERENLIRQVKSQSDVMIGTFQGTTVGEVLTEMNKALEISEKLGVDFERMLSDAELSKQYLRLRYAREEFARLMENHQERVITQISRMGRIQLEELTPQPTVSIDDPSYKKELRKIAKQKRLIEWQMERRAKKLRKFARRNAKRILKEIWG